jgi:hypothetical protein
MSTVHTSFFAMSTTSYMYLAFKFGSFLVISDKTLVCAKIMFEVPCRHGLEDGCEWCMQSPRKRGSSFHYLTYSADTANSWHMELDCLRFENTEWTFLRIPIPNADKAHRTVRQQLWKSFNSKGFWFNFTLGTRYGTASVPPAKTAIDFTTPDSWLCTELACLLLADQSPAFRQTFQSLVPCQLFPLELWAACRLLPNVKALSRAPWNDIPSHRWYADTLTWPPEKECNDDGTAKPYLFFQSTDDLVRDLR